MAGRDIAGRIYISWQGINAQYSGPMEDAHAYAEWVASRPGFSGLAWRTEASAALLRVRPGQRGARSQQVDTTPLFFVWIRRGYRRRCSHA